MNELREEIELEDRCEYCGGTGTDHKHGNGHRCCGDCCATHGSLAHDNEEAYNFVKKIVTYKNGLIEQLKSSLAANREQKAEIERLNKLVAYLNSEYKGCSDLVVEMELSSLRASVGEKWIDVKQELPYRSRVLVYFPSESTSIMDALFDGVDFHVDGFRRTKAVTHWQPLPAPPTLPGEEKS